MTKRGRLLFLTAVAVALLVFASMVSGSTGGSGSAGSEEKKEGSVKDEPVLSRDAVLVKLPCFKCHDLNTFMTKEEKGVFSHKKHSKFDVHCNQCHTVTGHHGKPELQKPRCEGCHSLKPFTYDAGGLTVRFEHNRHTRTLSCSDCHPLVFDMRKGSRKMTMDDIYKGKFCGTCHDGKKAFASDQCTKCHNMKGFKKPLTYDGGGMGKVKFSHEFHTTAFQCDECHNKRFPMKKSSGKMKMDDMYAGKSCGGCHNGQMAFSAQECDKCHKQ